MFTMEDLKPFFDNATMEVNGINFRLKEAEDMAGELAVWCSDKYKVMATPFFDDIPVAVELLEINGNGDYNTIDVDGYYGEVNSFEQYVEVVKNITLEILNKHKYQ